MEKTKYPVCEQMHENEKLAIEMFPSETWLNLEEIIFNHIELPNNAAGIKIAKGKLPQNMHEEKDLLKEIKSAIILKDKRLTVTLIPRIKRPDGKGFFPGPDAIVNGTLFEFKTVTGSMDKVGARFRDSREQGENVFIRIENPNLTKPRVVSYLARFIRNDRYKGGYKGKLILSFGEGVNQKTYFYRISDFKK